MSDPQPLTDFEKLESRMPECPECDPAIRRAYPMSATTDLSEEVESDQPFIRKSVGSVSSMWAIYDKTNYVACDSTIKKIPPGLYSTQENRATGVFLKKETVILDDLIELPDPTTKTIMADVLTFWDKKDHFKKLGFVWKRGILLYGSPGCGKTSAVQQICTDFISRGGVCIFMTHPKLMVAAVKMLRVVEPNRPIAVLMEDLDAIVYNYGDAEILALMDGELQVDNVLFVATTNYPEKLDRRLVCRPSRFDIVREVSMPSKEARETYLKIKNPRLTASECDKELKRWVEDTHSFSIAHLKELIISVEVFQLTVDESIRRLKAMTRRGPSSTDATGGFGFVDTDAD